MRTWTATKRIDAEPAAVLGVLTDTDAVRRWSPVPFDLDDDADRLIAGARMRVSGQLVGKRVRFDVQVHEAGDGRLALTASGPVAFDVAYEARAAGRGMSDVCASVSLRSCGGLFGRLAEQATAALLTAGALGVAVDRIAASAAA